MAEQLTGSPCFSVRRVLTVFCAHAAESLTFQNLRWSNRSHLSQSCGLSPLVATPGARLAYPACAVPVAMHMSSVPVIQRAWTTTFTSAVVLRGRAFRPVHPSVSLKSRLNGVVVLRYLPWAASGPLRSVDKAQKVESRQEQLRDAIQSTEVAPRNGSS